MFVLETLVYDTNGTTAIAEGVRFLVDPQATNKAAIIDKNKGHKKTFFISSVLKSEVIVFVWLQ